MANSKTTKKALLSSALALTMCVAMLIATTFAWFTDTASTSVNKIQAGTLDVGLKMYAKGANEEAASWKDAEGETLEFKKASTESGTDVLWEPGCTYELPAVRVVNKGNLAFKYKIAITGATGDTKLLDVIKFTVKFNDEEINLDNWEGMLLPTGKTATTGTKEQVGESSDIVISGHMDENAGNEYQGLSVSGIGITVYATQYTYEYDSYDNKYDLSSMYVFDDYVSVTTKVNSGGQTVIQDKEDNPTITATIPAGSLANGITELALIKKPTANPDSVKVETGNSALTTDVKIIDTATNQVVTAQGDTYFTIDIMLGQVDLKEFYHKGEKLTKVGKDALTSAGLYYYDFDSGVVTFTTKDFSTFTAVFKFAGGNGTEQYPYLVATAEQAMAMPGETGTKYFKLLDDVVIDKTIAFAPETASNYTLDLNGKTIRNNTDLWGKATTNDWSLISARANANLTITGNGTLQAKENDCYAMDACDSSSSITIENGTFIGNGSAIYIYQGQVTIKGGCFSIQQLVTGENGYRYTLNSKDDHHKDGTAKFTVSGGTFKNYDPSNSKAEDPTANIVAVGYEVVSGTDSEATWYTVVPSETD